MADLTETNSALMTKLTGANSSGAEQTPVQSTSAGELLVSDLITTAGTEAALTVGTSAIEVKAGISSLSNRKLVTVFNNSNNTVYWGRTSSVTILTGTPLFKNQLIVFEGFQASSLIYLISASAGNNVRITES